MNLAPNTLEPAPPEIRTPRPGFFRRQPFVGLVLLAVASNLGGSVFSFLYNDFLIVRRFMTEKQTDAFWNVACTIYNVVAYPAALMAMFFLMRPLIQARQKLLSGAPVDPAFLDHARKRLINLPAWQLVVNLIAILPGGVIFPAVICGVGGTENASPIWGHFVLSFVVTALFTTMQTYFPFESYLTRFLYSDFFKDVRPADIQGVVRLSFAQRVVLLWVAAAWVPLLALLVLAINFVYSRLDPVQEIGIALGVFAASSVTGFVIFAVVGLDLRAWVRSHGEATDRIARGDLETRIGDQRPDEWGRLTDRFNDMALALLEARETRDTFGEFVSPEVRDQILDRYHGLEVKLERITVLFADIRGFTRRCAGEDPAKVGSLLNRFLTLAVQAIEQKGGYVNKFLGDGVMALFGATGPREDHADLALDCAREMLARLAVLNADLEVAGEQRLVVGIGIHTGPALVGCFGATLDDGDKPRRRREFTAIGETVNFAQRMEQLTKSLGGPIIVSHATRTSLRIAIDCIDLGAHPVPGSPECIFVWRVAC
ncbi:MAG: HAMP domain-containing protein [Gemmataceae bacterium]|nr:HAMP domain-containing protein [Gemmataceae bacterium]